MLLERGLNFVSVVFREGCVNSLLKPFLSCRMGVSVVRDETVYHSCSDFCTFDLVNKSSLHKSVKVSRMWMALLTKLNRMIKAHFIQWKHSFYLKALYFITLGTSNTFRPNSLCYIGKM